VIKASVRNASHMGDALIGRMLCCTGHSKFHNASRNTWNGWGPPIIETLAMRR
jgi:hypothetical protein